MNKTNTVHHAISYTPPKSKNKLKRSSEKPTTNTENKPNNPLRRASLHTDSLHTSSDPITPRDVVQIN